MQTQIVTLTVKGANTTSYSLSTNQIVTMNSMAGGGSISAEAIFYQSNGQFTEVPTVGGNLGYNFTGLTNISVAGNQAATEVSATFTILTPSTNSVTYTPANSVVIPSDATGNVQIILQSSSDMVNWVPTLPGTYGSTYTNRFFRVIAVAQ